MSTTTLRSTLPTTPTPQPDPSDAQQVASNVAVDATGQVIALPEGVTVTPTSLPADDFDTAAGLTPAPVQPSGAAPTAVQTTTPAAPTRSAFAEAIEDTSDGAVTGDWSTSDVRMPRIVLVNGNGELSRTFTQGTLILNETEILPTPKLQAPDPKHFLRFAPILLEKSFQEKLSDEQFKAGIRARTASTIDEVTRLGGTLRKIGDSPATWEAVARCVLLIEQNEFTKDNAFFALAVGDKQYALVQYYARGWAWSTFASTIFSCIPTILTEPMVVNGTPVRDESTGRLKKKTVLHRLWWTWRTEKSKGDYPQFIPKVVVSRDQTDAAVREFIEQLNLTGRA